MFRTLQQSPPERCIVFGLFEALYFDIRPHTNCKEINNMENQLKKLHLICSLVAALIFSPVSAEARYPEVTPGNDFQGINVDMSSMGGVIVVYAGVREISGNTAVCGVVFFEKPNGTLKSIESKVTAKLLFSIAGKRLNVRTSAFKRYTTEDEARAGTARCWVTKTPWAVAYGKTALKIELERGSISF